MAENLDVQTLANNPVDSVSQSVTPDVNQSTQNNLETTVGSTMQQTLFWNYSNNTAPTNLKANLSKDYPNLLQGGPGPKYSSAVKPRPKTQDEIAKDVWNSVVQNNPGIDRANINNPGSQVSRYDEQRHNAIGYIRGADNEALHAERLGGLDYAMIGVRNGLLKGATVALGSIGMLGKLPAAALSGDLSSVADNWLTNWSDKVYENKTNQIYHPGGYDAKGAIEKLGTATWWADQGADMAGFVAGNLLPASVVSKIGLAGKASKLLGNALYAEKAALAGSSVVGTELGNIAKIGNTLANNTRWLNSMSTLETAATSTITEAGYEGLETKKRIYQDLLSKGYTPDQAMQVATKNANTVIGLNMAVLFPSSLWEVNTLLKGASNLKAAAKLIKNGVNGAELTAPKIGSYLAKGALGSIEGAVVEGVWEENVQNSIQQYGDKLSKGQLNPGVANMFKSLLSDSIDNFSSPEGQENIVGGMVMGVLMGGFGGAKQLRDNYKQAEKILPVYNSSYTNYQQLSKDIVTLSSYLKDKSNYIETVQGGNPKLDSAGNVVINKGKLIADIKGLGLSIDLSNTMAHAADKGDNNLLEIAKSQLIGEFVYNHSSNGMSDRMFNKLSTWQNMSQDDKNSLGIISEEKDSDGNVISFTSQVEAIKVKAKEYDRLWNHVDSFFPDILGKDRDGNEYGYDTKSIFQEAILNKSLLDRLNSIEASQDSVKADMTFNFDQNIRHIGNYLQTSLKEKNNNLNPFDVSVDPEAKIKAYTEVNPDSQLTKQLNQLREEYNNYTKALDSSNKRYQKLTNKEAVTQKLAKTISSKEKAQDKIKEEESLAQQAETKKQKAREQKQNIDSQIEILNTTLADDTLDEESRAKAEKEKADLISQASEVGAVIDDPGTNMEDFDIAANAGQDNVFEDVSSINPASVVSTDSNPNIGGDMKGISPSFQLGVDTLTRAQKAVDALIKLYENSPEASIENILDGKSPEDILNIYDNVFGSKDTGTKVYFGGKTYRIGDRFKDLNNSTIWKVKGVAVDGTMQLYNSVDPSKTTLIKDNDQLDNYEHLTEEKVNKETSKPDKKDNEAKPLEKGVTPNRASSNAFRIPNGNTFVEVFQNVFTMNKEAVNELLTRITPDELMANVSVIFKRETDPKKLEMIKNGYTFHPMDSSRNTVQNPQLAQKGATPFRFQIMYKGEILGFGTNPNKYIFKDANGIITSPNNFTQQTFEDVYDTNQKNPVTLGEFKKNYEDAVKLYSELFNRLGAEDEIMLSPAEVNSLFGLKINAGEYDYSTDKQYKLSELNYNTIAGEVYVLDMQNVGANGTTNKAVISSISDITKIDEVENIIEQQLQGPITPEILKNYGRYVSVIQLPNGAVKFVELSTPVLTDTEKENLLTTLQERQKESFNNIDQKETEAQLRRVAKDNTFNDPFNEKLNNDIFIAIKDVKRVFASLNITPTGVLKLEVSNLIDPSKPEYADIYLNRELTDFKNIDELIKDINRVIKEYNNNVKSVYKVPFKLDSTSFKRSVPMNLSTDEYMDMQTSVNPNIVKNASIEIEVKDFTPIARTVPVIKEKTPSIFTQAINEDVDSLDLGEMVNESTQDLTSIELSRVLDKVTRKDQITPDVYNFIKNELKLDKSNALDTIKIVNTRYLNIYDKKTEEVKAPLEVGSDTLTTVLEAIRNIKKTIEEVKDQLRNNTLVDENGAPFLDKKTANIYAKGLLDNLNSRLNNLLSQLPKDRTSALKIIQSQTSVNDNVSLNEFKSWLKQNLPSYIDVVDIDTLMNNISVNGLSLGIFQTNLELINGTYKVTGGSIGTREENSFKYHEAFHAVFRLLLPEARIKLLLDEAKKEYASNLRAKKSTLKEAIDQFKQSSSLYTNLTEKQAEERIYEEYMADKFDQWKTNKSIQTSPTIKSLFKKILDWFKAFTSRIGLSRQDMLGLFEDVNRGRYKNVSIQANRFTTIEEQVNEGMLDDHNRPIDNLFPFNPALKLIQIGEEQNTDEFGNVVVSPKYLTQSESNKIVGSVAAVFLSRANSWKGTFEGLIDNILEDYGKLYDSNNDVYTEREDYIDIIDRLDALHTAYTNPESKAILKEAINYSLLQLGYKQSEEEQILEDDADELGDRQVGNYTIETSAIGGFGSLSKDLRRYIASTTYQVTDDQGNPLGDDFGNKFLVEGEPLVEAVNSNIVYGGILKALANINDTTVFVNRLVEYAEGDSQSAIFIQRFINDTGLVVNEDGTYTISKNPTLFQMVVKGFNQYKVDYIFSQKDANNKVSRTFLSNQRDVAQTQFAEWYNSFTDLYQDRLSVLDDKAKEAFTRDRLKILTKISGFLSLKSKMSMPDVDKHARDLHTALKAAYGIDLSSNYIKYSIIAGMAPDNRNTKQVKYFNAFSGVVPLSVEDINEISKTLQAGNNPFVKEQVTVATMDENGIDIESIAEIDKANIGRLKKIAENNAIFDETVVPSSFINAENKTIYGHQLPTFHLVATTDLTSRDYRKQLKKDSYLNNNYLLNSPLFEKVADSLRVARIDGLRQVTLSQDENGNYFESSSLDVNKRDGITYGKYSDREFMLNLFDLYLYQDEYNYQNEKNETIRFNTSSHLIRVLEASSTGDTISLPIQRLFQNGNITEQAKNALVNEVVNEYRRIQEVKAEIKAITNREKTEGIIQDYHNGKLKGLRFFKTANMLGPLRSQLENKAQLEKNYKLNEEEIEQIRNQVTEYFKNQVDTLMNQMVSQNILQGNMTNGYTNVLLPTEIERGNYDKNGKPNESLNDKMFLTTNLKDNVGQIFMNDFMNTLAYNQLILGDAAKGLKDGVDEVKRAKGANGAGPSIEARITAPELGINHPFVTSYIGVIAEPKGEVSLGTKGIVGSVDRADAQMWLTPKGLRYTLFGLGKLNQKIADFLDKIESGEDILKEDVFGDDGSIEYNGQTNSIKLVYYDGHKYIKTSGAMLQRQALSYKDENGEWQAIPGREALHNKLNNMEAFESAYNTVSFIVPKSASKAISEDIMKTDMSDFSAAKMKPLQNKFWRLQLENPSNKIKINDPTQAKQLIDMEQDDSIKVLFRGTETTIGDLRNMYQQDSEQRVKNNYIKARNTIFNIDEAFSELQTSIDQNKVTPKLSEFQTRALESLQASGADSQLMAFFELDEQGNPKYNLNMSMTLDKYTQLFLAYFSKGVTNEKIPGHAVALMSDYGMQMMREVTAINPDTKKPTAWRTIRSDEFKKNPKKYRFKDLDTEIFEVGDYYTSDLQHNVPEYNEQGQIVGYYSEFMLPAHFAELMDIKPGDPIPDSVSKAFGVRIPSQDKHSFISLKMVEFLPANMGSTGIFAKELVKLSGADFDIDKLYMSIASWYKNDKGELVRYGDTPTTDQERFDEFLHFELNNNKDLKKLYKKKLKNNQDYNALKNSLKIDNNTLWTDEVMNGIDEEFENSIITIDEVLSLSPSEVNSYIKDKVAELKKIAINESLSELGLPDNLNDFIEQSKKGELNNGVLNNRILDAKIQFLTNNHIRPDIASEAAGVDLLADMVNDPDLTNAVIKEFNLDTDSILGKTAAFKNNKEGANNIGPAVNAMLVYSLLNKFGIGFRNKIIKNEDGSSDAIFKLRIDGQIFDSYANTIATDGNRIMNNISTVVSAMTDNAKERLAAKFNMSMSAIGTLCNMLAQGVPMKTTISILLQPSIKQYFDATKRFSYKFSDKTDKMLNGEKVQRSEVGQNILESIKQSIPEGTFNEDYIITTEELLAHTRGEVNNPMLQWKVLSDYMKMETQSKYYSSISQIIKLSKGLGTSFDYGDAIKENIDKLGLYLNDKEFEESVIPFDVRQILTAKDTSSPYHNITANYLKIFNQINELSKSLFIEKTDTFNRIKEIVFSNMDFSKDEFNIPEEATKMKKNLISYLTFKSYMKLMNDEGKGARIAGLSNKLLYDNIEGGNNVRNIVEVLKMAREVAPDNYLVKKFLMAVPTVIKQKGEIVKNPANRDGINKVESNTWAKISNTRSEMLQDSFKELYNNPETKQYAITLFNYLIVKDGLQFKSGSFLKLVPNFMFYDVLRGTTKANEVMKLNTKSLKQSELDQKYRDTFGATQGEIFNDFIDIYLSNTNNSFHIPQITGVVKNNESKRGIKYTNDLKNELLINIFAEVKENQITSRIEDGKLIVESNSGSKLTNEERSRLSENLTDIKNSGFRLENFEQDGKKKVEVNFPYIITVGGGKNQKSYYKLVSVGNIGLKEDAKASSFIKQGETIAKGTRAKYVQIKLKGSRAQTSIAQMFGDLPTTDSIISINKNQSINNNAGTENDSIMGNEGMDEYYASMEAGIMEDIFGVNIKEGTTQGNFQENSQKAQNPNLDTDPEKGENPFYTAVNDNFDLSGMDDFFTQESEEDIKDGMDDMNVQDSTC